MMDLLEDKLYHKLTNLSDLIDEYDIFLFDIWGVLHEGGELYDGIPDLINKIAAKKIVRIISNAPRLKNTTAQNLIDKSLKIDYEMMFTSGETARIMLRESTKFLGIDSLTLYHLGEDRNKEILSGIEVAQTENLSHANLILLSAFRFYGEDHESIIKILEQAISYNIPVLCANPDNEVLHMGKVSVCAGYFARIYEKMGGKVFYSGKPERLIFEQALASCNSLGKRILMVGDTFETDIHGSHNMNIDSALVTTGNMGRAMQNTGISDKIDAANKVCAKHNFLPNYLLSMK